MVCHHGAGYSGLSFACLAKEVADVSRGECGVLSIDARRHGQSYATLSIFILIVYEGKTTSSANDEDLSIDVLADDLFALIQNLYPDPSTSPTFLASHFHTPVLHLILSDQYPRSSSGIAWAVRSSCRLVRSFWNGNTASQAWSF
jgi:hypothetical protein